MFFSILRTLLNPFNAFKSTSLVSAESSAAGLAEQAFEDAMSEAEEPIKPFIQIHTSFDMLVAYNDIGAITFRDLTV